MAGLTLRRPGRRKPVPATVAPVVPERAGAKNKPTPKRSAAVASRPVTPYLDGAGKGRRGAARADSSSRRGTLDSQRAAMKGEGSLADLPVNHRSPERGFVRGYVDRRRNLLTLIVLAYALLLVNAFVKNQAFFTLFLAIVFLAVVDALVLSFAVQRAVRAEFPDSRAKVRLYAIQRAAMPRRFRLPRPGVGVPGGAGVEAPGWRLPRRR